MFANNELSPDLPLITIGVTCHNAEATIGRAIESARNQDWPKLEIIVVDDGSSDGSPEIIKRLADEDHRITWIQHDGNRGYAGALNSIVESAQGEYIAIFDDDDLSVPERVTKQWRKLTEYAAAQETDLILCYSNRTVVDDDGSHSTTVHAIGRKPVEPRGEGVADFLLWHYVDPGCTWGQFGSCTLLVRKQTLSEIGPFDEGFRRSAEWDFAIRLALVGGCFVAVDEPLITQYKTHTADKSGKVPLKYALKLRRKYKSYLKRKKVYRAAVAIAYSRYYYAMRKSHLSRLYLALACVCSPSAVLPNELAKWRRRKRSRASRRRP